MTIITAHPTTLVDFIRQVSDYAASEPLFNCYRGQRDASWANIPGLFRPDRSRLEEHENRATRDLISVHPAEFANDATMFDRLVRMQHFGLPTRLMDVSRNPLVALFFATHPGADDHPTDGVVTAFAIPADREKYYDSDSVSCVANLANLTKAEKQEIIDLRAVRARGTHRNDEIARVNQERVYHRLQQFVRVEKPHFEPAIHPIDLFKPFYVHPKMSNRRILSQAGGFIIHGLIPPSDIKFGWTIKETRFVIPADCKEPLRQALDLLGINESTLFPEIDKAAQRIEARYSN
ncbi:FRG domain-containing protein [Sphingomonas sp. CLY1604]|uniref:FRG domain-containing protein n=1 Tax=Sphingomonas sp. CLY1604 TaxID=3457786 RepID=UPI003FD812BB